MFKGLFGRCCKEVIQIASTLNLRVFAELCVDDVSREELIELNTVEVGA
jgi:hypothetical protein